MKTASIISIGNEILSGLTVDTNSAWLSQQLFSIGVPTTSHHTVGDDLDLIVDYLKLAQKESDIVLVTGGLGPTDDDLTRQAFAKFMGVKLQLKEQLLEDIKCFFTGKNYSMPEKNIIQAYIPIGAAALRNDLGTAPGIILEKQGKFFAAMPGVPCEMKAMFAESVMDKLVELCSGQTVISKRLKCFGAGESTIAEKLGDLMNRNRNPLINCTVHFGVITLHIIAKAKTQAQAEDMISKDEKNLRQILGELVYGIDDETLAQVVGNKLTKQGKTVALAESCTGGLIAKLITDIAGASDYFKQSWVTYSNDAKITQLSVAAELIEKYGAVSPQVAEAMAKGAKNKAKSDYAIGITGIAGPTGASEQKPVGLVYISVASDKKCVAEKFIFSHNRSFIRLRAAQTALNLLCRQLDN
ncbi:MAG: competence/damage-inducible protein A [Planctomycetes bacterium]|nr:competence/damage-inducible protein A [Planctomycetota bacterium]